MHALVGITEGPITEVVLDGRSEDTHQHVCVEPAKAKEAGVQLGLQSCGKDDAEQYPLAPWSLPSHGTGGGGGLGCVVSRGRHLGYVVSGPPGPDM